MNTVIVTTRTVEQQEMMSQIYDRLKFEYLTDTTVSIVKTSMSRIDVLHRVKDMNHIAASYHVILVPVSMSLDNIKGYSHKTNINITRLIKRLDEMKTEAIQFVNSHKMPTQLAKNNREAFSKATRSLFNME